MWWGGRRLCILGGRDVVPEVRSYRLGKFRESERRGSMVFGSRSCHSASASLTFLVKTGVYLPVLRKDHPIQAQLH